MIKACTSDGAMLFYSITVIINVLVGIQTYLLFVVFRIIHRVIFLNITILSLFQKCVIWSLQELQKSMWLSTAEKKIVIAMWSNMFRVHTVKVDYFTPLIFRFFIFLGILISQAMVYAILNHFNYSLIPYIILK